jgi:hypothetical protein
VPGTATAGDARKAVLGQMSGSLDLWLELFVLFNFFCLSGDIILAHSENHFRNPAEYFPLWFSFAAVLLLLGALTARMHFRRLTVWTDLGCLVGWASIVLGIAGVVYHLDSSFFYERTLKSLTYAAPFAAPLAYVGLGCLLLMNRMVLPRTRDWAQWVFFFTLGGMTGNFVLSLSDHAVNGFFRWTEWIPVVSSAFAVGFLLAILFFEAGRLFLRLSSLILLVQIAVGGLGFFLHLRADLRGPAPSLLENIITGAPPFAPLLLPNLSLLGFIGIAAMKRELS